MNRKKKLTQIHKKRVKAVAAKNSGKKKSGYVSKAERAKLEAAAEAEHSTQAPEQNQNWEQAQENSQTLAGAK